MSLTFCRCAAGQVHRGQIGFLRCAYLFSAGAGILSPYCNMATDNWKDAHSIYDLVAKDINGEDVLLSKYEGHVVLIVNVGVASQTQTTSSWRNCTRSMPPEIRC